MSLLELFAIVLILYYLFHAILCLVLDCNIELWYKEWFGKPIASLRGQVVWITGASSGIGKGLAITLAKHGVQLVLSARREELLHEVRAECLKQSQGLLSAKDVLVMRMDMLDLSTHQQCFERVLENFGKLDILVNNAGRSQRANWEDINVQVDRDLFELDVFSVVSLSRIVVRYFIKQAGGHGHLAVTSSVAGLIPVPFSATYCAAKHAVNAYFAALKLEHPNIDVTLFAPGPIETNFLQDAFTAQPDEKVGGSTRNDKNRMTAERCGNLFALALANKSYLSWCGRFPAVALTYIIQCPALAKIVMKSLGLKTMKKIREGK